MEESKSVGLSECPHMAELRLEFSDLEFLRRLKVHNVGEIQKKVPDINHLSPDGILAFIGTTFPDGKKVDLVLTTGGCFEKEWPYFALEMYHSEDDVDRIFPLDVIDGIYQFNDNYAVNVRVVDRGMPMFVVDSALGVL